MARRAKQDSGIDGASVGDADNVSIVDPGEISGTEPATDAGNEPVKRKRGRPAGTGSGTGSARTAKEKSLDLSGIAATLYGIHMMLAVGLKKAELNISETEAANMATAINNVQRHYDIQATQKTMDWINLAMVCGSIYVPRIIAMNLTKPAPPANNPAPINFGAQTMNAEFMATSARPQ